MAEAMMRLFFNQMETGSFVNAVRSGENALRPKNDLSIACCASETDALVYQGVPEACTSGAGLDKQETKLRRVW